MRLQRANRCRAAGGARPRRRSGRARDRHGPRLARPPYGDDAERFERVAAELGLRTVLWTVDPEDWREPPPPADAISERVLAGLEPGAVVLLHDGFEGGRDHATVRAVAALLPELARRGYRCVPADA